MTAEQWSLHLAQTVLERFEDDGGDYFVVTDRRGNPRVEFLNMTDELERETERIGVVYVYRAAIQRYLSTGVL